MASPLAELNNYSMLMQDTMTKQVAYIRMANDTTDPKSYCLYVQGAFEIKNGELWTKYPIVLEDWFQNGHTYEWYLVYAPFDVVLNSITDNDILKWTIRSRIFNESATLIFAETVKLKDVISESGVWTYNRDGAIESNKYKTLETPINEYTTL